MPRNVHTSSILNEVLNSHLAVVPNFNEDEIVLALNEDNTGLQHYAMGFWKPLPKERPFQKRFYLIQSSAQTESPLVKKQPEIFENLIGKVAQKSDFINVSIFPFKIFTSNHGFWAYLKKKLSLFDRKPFGPP